MAILEGLEVRIKCNGEFLQEYDDPEAEANEESSQVVKYIEAVPNAKFSIHLSVSPEFNYFAADALRLRTQFDHQKARVKWRGKRDALVVELSKEKFLCPESGEWKCSKFCFGSVDVGTSFLSLLIPSQSYSNTRSSSGRS